ncbi:hypothetical protein NDK50_14815 [Paraburkholderia bryophila]|uniref:hypothetical protein n=1 Tax=Paraburkholderia bryophila TaxID=420952 RepID=UPI00234B7941|nr:hypothetical protein [Paraburkholderia bryophila]WCM18706.1 hypothetical protein NDK50_14815 [Paraburkholderia bryophila]
MNEGVAVTSEYIVAMQLGLNGQINPKSPTDPYTTYSDPNDIITPQLTTIAQDEGINVLGLTYGSAATTAFVQPDTAATDAAAAFYGSKPPSVAPYLTYQQYRKDFWIVNNSSALGPSIDWSKVQQSMFSITANSNGTYTISVTGLPQLPSAGGGTAPTINGIFSAPAPMADGSGRQTSTFTNPNGVSVSTLLFGLDGVITTSFYDPTTNALIGINTTSANGLSLVDTTLYAGKGSITSVTEQNGEVFVNASGATISATGGDTATVTGGSNVIAPESGSTFTLEGIGTNADTLNLAGATDVTALLGNAAAAIDLGTNMCFPRTRDGGDVRIQRAYMRVTGFRFVLFIEVRVFTSSRLACA